MWYGGLWEVVHRRSSKILMPDLMGHHLASPAGHDSSAQHVREQDRDFWYTKARSVLIKPQHKSDKFNVDGEVRVYLAVRLIVSLVGFLCRQCCVVHMYLSCTWPSGSVGSCVSRGWNLSIFLPAVLQGNSLHLATCLDVPLGLFDSL